MSLWLSGTVTALKQGLDRLWLCSSSEIRADPVCSLPGDPKVSAGAGLVSDGV